MRILIGLALFLRASSNGQDAVPKPTPQDFQRLQGQIRPQPGESPWRDIEWLTSIRGARERAAREGKPILIFTAADGSPLART